MATAGKTLSISLSETLFYCHICMDRFDSPRILPCQHNMCRSCILQLALHQCVGGKHPVDGGVIKKASFPCPECRRECRVGRFGTAFDKENVLARFPENRLVKHLVEEAQIPKRTGFANVSVQTCAEEEKKHKRTNAKHVGVQTLSAQPSFIFFRKVIETFKLVSCVQTFALAQPSFIFFRHVIETIKLLFRLVFFLFKFFSFICFTCFTAIWCFGYVLPFNDLNDCLLFCRETYSVK